MKADQHAREMNEKVRNINEIIRQIQQLDVANMMERSLPDDASWMESNLIGPCTWSG